MIRISTLFLAAVVTACAACAAERRPLLPRPRDAAERGAVLRESSSGPVVLTYASAALSDNAPPDGVRAALLRSVEDAEEAAGGAHGHHGASGSLPLSAATFHWEGRERAMLWVRSQMEERRRRGEPVRVILAGHGPGATEASETARELLFHERDFAIVLLLTVDAVKADRYGSSAAYAAGTALAGRLGVEFSFSAYAASPAPDGRTLYSHINYYQDASSAFHGSAMPHAENHRLSDPSGLLNHANADDFAMPELFADFRHALARSRRDSGVRPEPPPGGFPR